MPNDGNPPIYDPAHPHNVYIEDFDGYFDELNVFHSGQPELQEPTDGGEIPIGE